PLPPPMYRQPSPSAVGHAPTRGLQMSFTLSRSVFGLPLATFAVAWMLNFPGFLCLPFPLVLSVMFVNAPQAEPERLGVVNVTPFPFALREASGEDDLQTPVRSGWFAQSATL